MAEDTASITVEWALKYIERGGWPIPLLHRSKAAADEAWQELRIAAEEAPARFRGAGGVGLLAGVAPSNWVDVDLDTPEAVAAARLVMTPTGMRHGRPSRPESHRWYAVHPLPEKGRVRFDDPLVPKGGESRLLLEIRSTGHQTAVPPSVHPEGEALVWHEFAEPAPLKAEALVLECGRAASVAFLARHWGEWSGQHHELILALAGGVLRGGYDEAAVLRLVEAVCAVAGDHEPEARLRAVRDTAQAFEGGVRVTGWGTVESIVGAAAARALRRWLGIVAVHADDRPAVEVVVDLDRVSTDAWVGVRQANDPPLLFRRSNKPVRVERIDDSDIVVLRDLNDILLRHHLSDLLRWYKRVEDGEVPMNPPPEVVKNMLAEEDIPLPIISRVVTVPVFAPNGALQTEPGYHPEAKVYYTPPAGLVVPAVPARPTDGDVGRARSLLLDELLADFPFVDEADRAHAVALGVLP
ncbi:MAG: bifunctional DNA primase/polymerase, partial [Chloroflexota bacterium]|nr:bifunctional DNA primase/polymerase [Chloroflexota bacterium]